MWSTGLSSFQLFSLYKLQNDSTTLFVSSLSRRESDLAASQAGGRRDGVCGWGRRIAGINLVGGVVDEDRGVVMWGRSWRTHHLPFPWDERRLSLCNRVSPTGATRSGAVIDSLSAGPYIRRRVVGVPATVLPQVLQCCGWNSIQSGL